MSNDHADPLRGAREAMRSRTIPIQPEAAAQPEPAPELSACAASEPFALMVMGDSMMPEFEDRDIIIIEPDGLATDGSFVLAQLEDEYTFRQLARAEQGWALRALNPAYPEIALADLSSVKGVIIQKSKPGRRRASKRYVE
ncbi:MAG: S24 family peptidase [Burkholderiaceae bacterium]